MAQDPTVVPTIDHKPHAAFFRQSGWLMIANIIAGMMSLGVHFLNKWISNAEYANFGALMMVTACLPTIPLQMVLAQQSAQALAMNRERQLGGMIRLAWIWTTALWAVFALVVLVGQHGLVDRWQLPNATGLWLTVFAMLMALWGPMFSGVLQGRQDFFWLGWGSIIGGTGRLVFASLFVLAFAMGSAGMMTGALGGNALLAGIAIWRTRDLWSKRSEPFDVKASLGQIVPLMFGFGACQFLFTSDTMFAKAFFTGDEMKPYVVAGTLSRALLWLVLPLAAVMFPKLVHSSVKAEKTNLMAIVLLGTAVLAICGGVGLWLVGPWFINVVFKSGDVEGTMRLIPWYAGAMVPLALANVVVNDLLARSRFKIVPLMVAVAVAYGLTLRYVLNHSHRLEAVLQTLGAFNLLLLAVAGWFVFRGKDARA